MRIVHFIGSLDPACGGPPMIAGRLAAAQSALGHDVTLASVALDQDRQDVADQAFARVPGFSGVRQVSLPAGGALERLAGFRSRTTIARQVESADVVHLHSIWDTVLRVAAACCRRRRVPHFVLLNGMLDPWSLSQKALKKRLALKLAYRRMLEGATALHLGNQIEGELIDRLDLRVPRVVLPNGVFMEEIEPLPPSDEFHRRHPELSGRPYVLFLSRLHYKKGLDVLAAAFALVASRRPEMCLVVAGPDGGAREDFDRRIAEAGLTNRVFVVGPLYGIDKQEALVGAASFCLPSRQEGFSVAITEALAHGVPLVVTEGCHYPEVESSGAGRVVALSPAAIAAAIDEVSTPALRDSFARSGRELVVRKYTWPVIAKDCVSHYERALKPS